MLKHSKKAEENLPEEQGRVPGFGGYSTRHEYEKNREKKNPALLILQIVLLLVLVVFSCLGVISLIRGDFVPEAKKGGSGSIKVPTQSELSETSRDMNMILGQVEQSLITVEVEAEDGSFRYGTGFIVDDYGHAVCSSTVLEGESPAKNVTAFTFDGISASAEIKGTDEQSGVALLLLPMEYQYIPISVENSFFVKRGETLRAVSARKAKSFYGTVAEGMVGTVGPGYVFGKEEIYSNVIYLDIDVNPTLHGAVVVDDTGAAVGFLSGTIPLLYDTLAPVIPINIVYTMINEF
ncbi:MAG: trypsin-like peptidase domain-containing protein [Ruminococcaceae bacterium]|nr:trypsin-like peptidase domain-containing protein [Oscillospiraceae bacterium]